MQISITINKNGRNNEKKGKINIKKKFFSSFLRLPYVKGRFRTFLGTLLTKGLLQSHKNVLIYYIGII